MSTDDGKETPRNDKRILGEPFVLCAICARPIRKIEAVKQRGLYMCPDDVDVEDHEDEVDNGSTY